MISLSGHSGCDVVLYSNSVVRKTSPSVEYNDRLKNQMEKQQSFFHPTLKSPQIYNCGYSEQGMFYFDMEYVRGVNLSVYFQKERLADCLKTIDLVTSFQTQSNKTDIKKQIISKIQNIEVSDSIREIIESNNWMIDTGYGHGDLTFENIIVGKNNIYLIDFLDSFVNGSLVDESKLLQDAFCYWSFKNQTTIPKRKLLSVCERFNSRQHYCMLLVHLVRIIPYLNTSKKKELTCLIRKVETQINQF